MGLTGARSAKTDFRCSIVEFLRCFNFKRRPHRAFSIQAFSWVFGALLFTSSAQSQTEIAFKTRAETVKNLEKLLGADLRHSEEIFYARTNSHRLRLSEIYLEMTRDPDFQKKFPEFKPLLKDSTETMKTLLAHDASKVDEKARHAVRTLAMLQGYDYRNPNPGLKPEVDAIVREKLKDAIDDINRSDKAVMEALYKRKSPEWVRLHKSLTDVLDFYDTYKSRQLEFAKDGRRLVPPSEWLEKLNKEKQIGAPQEKDLDLMRRFAGFVEEKDPLKDSHKFTHAPDFFSDSKQGFKEYQERKFEKRAQSLLSQTKSPGIMKRFVRVSSSVKTSALRTGGVFGAVEGAFLTADYLIDPEQVSSERVLDGFVYSAEVSRCQTVGCHQFLKSCRDLLKQPESISLETLPQHSDFDRCLASFFSKPLEAQQKARFDVDLNNLLKKVSPLITGLTCEKREGEMKIGISTLGESQQEEFQTLYVDSKGLAHKLEQNLPFQSRIFFSSGKPQRLQNCPSLNQCRSFPFEQVRDEKLYFWKDDRNQVIRKLSPSIQIPLEAFRWAKRSEPFMQYQQKSIASCCERKSCQDSLELRSRNYFKHRNQDKGISSQASR